MVSLRSRLMHPRRIGVFVLTLLVIEFLDELVFGAREAAWPLVRADLNLDYIQIGLLLGIPPVIAGVIEMVMGVMADSGYRRRLIIGGGVLFALSVLMTALSSSFIMLLFSFILFYPSSGAFVSLSQATLMDHDPSRHEQNMARWTLAGSLGIFIGPLLLSLLGGDWRGLNVAFAIFTLVPLLVFTRFRIRENTDGGERLNLVEGLRAAFRELRRFEVVRWLALLQFSNLMLDVLYGYLALYLVDVVGADVGTVAIAITTWSGVGLVGDLLIIPLLERVRGLTYLRYSAVIELLLYPAFLLVPGIVPKIIILGLLGIFNAGWYSVLQAQLYTAIPNRSGSVLTIMNVFGLLDGALPFAIGAAAQAFGLHNAMWLLMLGPIALLIGIPRHSPGSDLTLGDVAESEV